jgi:hypothetical protein
VSDKSQTFITIAANTSTQIVRSTDPDITRNEQELLEWYAQEGHTKFTLPRVYNSRSFADVHNTLISESDASYHLASSSSAAAAAAAAAAPAVVLPPLPDMSNMTFDDD